MSSELQVKVGRFLHTLGWVSDAAAWERLDDESLVELRTLLGESAADIGKASSPDKAG